MSTCKFSNHGVFPALTFAARWICRSGLCYHTMVIYSVCPYRKDISDDGPLPIVKRLQIVTSFDMVTMSRSYPYVIRSSFMSYMWEFTKHGICKQVYCVNGNCCCMGRKKHLILMRQFETTNRGFPYPKSLRKKKESYKTMPTSYPKPLCPPFDGNAISDFIFREYMAIHPVV